MEKQKRGFAALDPKVQREIAASGGHASQATGRAHRFTKEEAAAAGRKSHETRKAKKQQLINNQLILDLPPEPPKSARIFGTMDEDGI